MLIEELHVGDKVHYQPTHFKPDEFENGIVKRVCENPADGCWVVYHCAGRWTHYQEYTGARTILSDLKKGWL